ncbi:MAG: hypothetical protein MJ051_07205 [Akkermansia sp.]|nr:hypothetical protein [Akkermansia sp.]
MRPLLPALLLLSLCACESVRTVYDENGRVVDDRPKSGESDLSAHFEDEFNAAFTEEKVNGVPTATSKRVSSYQKKLDSARREDKEFITHDYKGNLGETNLRGTLFTEDGKRWDGSKRMAKSDREAYSTLVRPDFMNETHGISHNSRNSANDASRMETGEHELGERASRFSTNASRYHTTDPDYYVAERRDKTPQPEITDFREYYRQSIKSTRALLNRDKAENAPNGGVQVEE